MSGASYGRPAAGRRSRSARPACAPDGSPEKAGARVPGCGGIQPPGWAAAGMLGAVQISAAAPADWPAIRSFMRLIAADG